ncbi:response regulator [Magnetospirillum sp. UT-4]|uniref:response regulator n=1 Tax=Magnetospirillum sp. UT-4 TaxID=2681467 RepID=UPI0013825386|nr:response regulator [Magnetospirillum sp. UT-4]CAA7614650.1 FOG: CheY-like receiver [Magnetospirillum sp. UT-4]
MGTGKTPSFHILIIDDDPGDVGLIKAAIAEGRFACGTDVAHDGVAALAMLRERVGTPGHGLPDLVLLDINMPRMRGPDVLKALKADEVLATIPVVMLTTSRNDKDIQASYDFGAAGYVTKPVDLESFVSAVHSIQEYWFGLVATPTR